MDLTQLENLQEQISQQLKDMGAFQPLPLPPQENTEIIQELYNFGYNFYENGKYDRAADFFKLLTQIDSEKVSHWRGLGASLQMQQLHKEAILAYSTAIVLNPDDQALYFHAAHSCYALGLLTEALETLDMAEKIASRKPVQRAFISQLELLRMAWSIAKDANNNQITNSGE